ncbi:hypothetical protein MTO96_006761 [Rhipicephalus appendiculatus]
MAAESPPSSATPFERPRRSLIHTSSHRRLQSIACTRMLRNLIASANATRLRHEQVQRLRKVVGEKPTALQLPVPAADAEATAGCPASSGDPCRTVSAAVTSNTSAVLERALPGVPGIIGGIYEFSRARRGQRCLCHCAELALHARLRPAERAIAGGLGTRS